MTVGSGEKQAETLEATLKEILVEDLFLDVPVDGIGDDDGLQDVLGLDSLGFVELRAQCEQRFGVRITDAAFTPVHFRSVRTVADLVRTLRADTAGEHVAVPK
ncbi:phosphopantetheine-binding protein [Streptomyces sp. NPDC006193]|uniref:acyl carrier protein n=1 Tax=Streptomyces sp. NPDC006193 TaxID=3155717 RepID=UPI0033B83F75